MFEKIEGGITAPQGFLAAGVAAGIKKSGKADLALIYSTVPATAAAVFTTNCMAAAPVIVSREHVANNNLSAIVVNSGSANACTGIKGMEDARTMAEVTGKYLSVPASAVLVSSTGIIGVPLPMEKVCNGIAQAFGELSTTGSESAMQAILTTDTLPKVIAYEFELNGITAKIGGIAKGSGMINPNMATMLAYITTDVAIEKRLLNKALNASVERSFNMITVDGDTSTNDTVCVLANGKAGNKVIVDDNTPEYQIFYEALMLVCKHLAQQIVRDGEGATKFISLTVKGAENFMQGKQIAMSIAKSPLVKTAFFGGDPNWGRILCAAGYSGVSINPADTALKIGDVIVVEGGIETISDPLMLTKTMEDKDIDVELTIGEGVESVTVWTCDFSYEYVKINGKYHT